MPKCRSCPAPILWALTENGKRIPLDPDPVEDGNMEIARTDDPPGLRIIVAEDDEGVEKIKHFARIAGLELID